MKKQTAVEWLIDMLITENEVTLKGENFKLFEMAKAMEKEQIERMYSEEDMRTAIFKSFLLGVDRGIYSKELEDKLIEQFKNNTTTKHIKKKNNE